MRFMKLRYGTYKGIGKRACQLAVMAFCVGLGALSPSVSLGNEIATESNVLYQSFRSGATGDLWNGWIGDLSFLDGKKGDGTSKKPYQISTKAQLMGLSELAAMGMEIKESQGTFPGDYSGAYFELARDIDLGGMDWIPIGFYQDSSQINSDAVRAFEGHFDGNGKTISNFRLYQPSWNQAGLFGVVENGEISNLTVKPGHVITAGENVGILAGRIKNSVIRDVLTAGTLKTTGNAGGIIGSADSAVIENCRADHAAMDAGKGKETFIGGIVGKAAKSVISDCTVNTGDSLSARIQGGGYVGGITGFQNDTDIFNVRVMGTIGGSGSQAIGGVTGKYASGKMKVARFEGKISSSGLGSAAREGTFIGTHDTGFHFRYGTEEGADLAFLFVDTEGKISAGICGSGIPDDNKFLYDAHIGFWHKGDNHYTLVQGQSTRAETERYFYEELETGMLHIIDTEEDVKEQKFSPDHFAPSFVGKPIRGFLVSVLQVDTAANVENYYDVASLTARGESAYSHDINKSRRGAVAPGDTVTVVTAPKNTSEEKYQMDGVPTYTGENGNKIPMDYQTGGAYRFVMPEHDTEISAVYKKVAANVRVAPEEMVFLVTEERTGDRKNPSVVTEVKNAAGKLIARYIDGKLEEGTQVQDVKVEAVVDKNNDVADGRVLWSVDDSELIRLKKNPDEDNEGYTSMSASIELNLEAGFFREIVERAEKEQADKNYQYPIPDTVYGNGTLGGLAVLTAKTRPAASFEGKPLSANCRIPVTFQIKDRTRVAAEGAVLDKEQLSFTVTRRLNGDRKNPKETITVSGPQTLSAAFAPDFFDKKDISWSVDDPNIIRLDAGGYGNSEKEEDYKNASVQAIKDAKWIRDIVAADDGRHKENPYGKRTGAGEKTARITVLADDFLGNRQTVSCEVRVRFLTRDETEIRAESIETDKDSLVFNLVLKKTGYAGSPVLSWTGTGEQKITAKVYPQAPNENSDGSVWPKLAWEADRNVILVKENGGITPVTNAEWIKEAMKKYPYSAEKRIKAAAVSDGLRKEVDVILRFRLEDKTYPRYSSGSSGSSGGSGGSRPTGSSSSGVTTSGTTRTAVTAPEGSVTGVWVQDGAGRWLFTGEGRTYADEWAYIHNPYAENGQESTSWFRFDKEGVMMTGWFKDPSDMRWYYFHERPDGSMGHMYTGWNEIDGSWYFFGRDGRMMTGWRWINRRCYYMDPISGRMYSNTVTPDGFTVDATGAWTINGEVQTLKIPES